MTLNDILICVAMAILVIVIAVTCDVSGSLAPLIQMLTNLIVLAHEAQGRK